MKLSGGESQTHFRDGPMSMRRIWNVTPVVAAGLLLVLVSGQLVSAQDGKTRPKPKQRVTFTAEFVPATAKPGDKVMLKVTAQPLPEHYFYAMTQGDGGKPLRLELAEFAGLGAVEAPKFTVAPKPTVETESGIDGEKIQLQKHKGETVFTTPLVVGKTAQAGEEASVAITVDYGVCDAKQCYFPPKVKLAAKLKVAR